MGCDSTQSLKSLHFVGQKPNQMLSGTDPGEIVPRLTKAWHNRAWLYKGVIKRSVRIGKRRK